MQLISTPELDTQHWSVTARTRRGRLVRIRHLHDQDAPLLADMYLHLSNETRRLRFFKTSGDLPEAQLLHEAQVRAHVDDTFQVALVALADSDHVPAAVGVARFAQERTDPSTAEFAIVLRDDYQREGLGSLMIDILFKIARLRGVRHMRAICLAENDGIQRLIHNTGLEIDAHTSRGETTMMIELGE